MQNAVGSTKLCLPIVSLGAYGKPEIGTCEPPLFLRLPQNTERALLFLHVSLVAKIARNIRGLGRISRHVQCLQVKSSLWGCDVVLLCMERLMPVDVRAEMLGSCYITA
jgi:hypothetical protein